MKRGACGAATMMAATGLPRAQSLGVHDKNNNFVG
jgi:hypothetical protein